MSVRAIREVFEHAPVQGSRWQVLVVLAEHINGQRPDAGAWPSTRQIARLANLGRSTVVEALVELQQHGIIKQGKQYTAGNYVYHLTDPSTWATSTPDAVQDLDRGPENQPPVQDLHRPVQDLDCPGTGSVPEPVEPQVPEEEPAGANAPVCVPLTDSPLLAKEAKSLSELQTKVQELQETRETLAELEVCWAEASKNSRPPIERLIARTKVDLDALDGEAGRQLVGVAA